MDHHDGNPPQHPVDHSQQHEAGRHPSQRPGERRSPAESTHNLPIQRQFEQSHQYPTRPIKHDPPVSPSSQGYAHQQPSNAMEDHRYSPYHLMPAQSLGSPVSAPSAANYSGSFHQYDMKDPSTTLQYTASSYWQSPNGHTDSRRGTVTQASHDASFRTRRQQHSSGEGHGPQRYENPYPMPPHNRRQSGSHVPWNSAPESSLPLSTYSTVADRRDTIRPHSLHQTAIHDIRRGVPSTSGLVAEPSALPYTGANLAGSIAIPQLASTDQRLYYGKHMSHSYSFQNPEFDAYQSPDQAGTPAPTEGSADPAQSDQEDVEWPTSTVASTTPSTGPAPTSPWFNDQYLPSGSTRWARFQVPIDVFLQPHDPARHQLLYTIRSEAWFLQQTNERPLSAAEAAQIPNAIAGESVLLGFFDRFTEQDTGRVNFICAICQRSSPNSPKPYNRPDRAKVHMRHHLEQRPIPCTGQCRKLGCTQRFFTQSDLSAHIAGKTESLVNCEWCNKPLRQKNMKRHQRQYCPKAPNPSQQ